MWKVEAAVQNYSVIKVVLKISLNPQENTSLFLNKVAGLQLC